MSLESIRAEIDRVDSEILKLLVKRMELSLLTVKFKQSIKDDKREREVLSNVISQARYPLTDEFIKKLYGIILEESKNLQIMYLKNKKEHQRGA